MLCIKAESYTIILFEVYHQASILKLLFFLPLILFFYITTRVISGALCLHKKLTCDGYYFLYLLEQRETQRKGDDREDRDRETPENPLYCLRSFSPTSKWEPGVFPGYLHVVMSVLNCVCHCPVTQTVFSSSPFFSLELFLWIFSQ